VAARTSGTLDAGPDGTGGGRLRLAAVADAAAADQAPASGAGLQLGDLQATLEPMLEAVVGLAGATAATIRVVSDDGSRFEPVAAVGFSGLSARSADGAIERWCSACVETRQPRSGCATRDLRTAEQGYPAERLGSVCRHVVAVPLQHRSRPVGILNLMFEAETALAPTMVPLLAAVGNLLGVTLENARLSREALRVSVMNERQAMAGEVHDSLAQSLTYMRMRMSLLRDAVREGDELRAFKYWSDVDDALGNAHRRLRELITYFRSRMDPQGLAHALRETADTFFERTGVRLELANQAPDLVLSPDREIEVFHIVQEALANVIRHAHASAARVTIDRLDAGYRVVVEDDGVGAAAYAPNGGSDDSGHYGLSIMRERASRLGGELLVESTTGGGTRVQLDFPAVDPPIENR
jgi:two-component system nitrate/nitrite sensor histidine kinase NarX